MAITEKGKRRGIPEEPGILTEATMKLENVASTSPAILTRRWRRRTTRIGMTASARKMRGTAKSASSGWVCTLERCPPPGGSGATAPG